MKRLLGFAACLPALLLVPLVSIPAPAHAGAVRCQGKPATIVGGPRQSFIYGTPGDDVVVTRGTSVSTKGGNDTVCITGDTSLVDTGDGDDVVVNRGTDDDLETSLGAGSDRYTGGPGVDYVDADDYDTDEVDVVRTRGGDDSVSVGASGKVSSDIVDLGDGDDRFFVQGRAASTDASLDGGAGSDQFWLPGPERADAALARRDWTADNSAEVGTLLAGPTTVASWTAFEQFVLLAPVASFTFVGGDRDESVRGNHLVSAVMGRGDDDVELGEPVSGAVLDGGEGSDFFSNGYLGACEGTATVDLGADSYTCTDSPNPMSATLLSIEGAGVEALRATLLGTDDDERFKVSACRSETHAGDGADRIQVYTWIRFGCSDTGVRPGRAYGEGGDDVLVGGFDRDILRGGDGHDRAVGRRGIDVCVAEVVRTCEES